MLMIDKDGIAQIDCLISTYFTGLCHHDLSTNKFILSRDFSIPVII